MAQDFELQECHFLEQAVAVSGAVRRRPLVGWSAAGLASRGRLAVGHAVVRVADRAAAVVLGRAGELRGGVGGRAVVGSPVARVGVVRVVGRGGGVERRKKRE